MRKGIAIFVTMWALLLSTATFAAEKLNFNELTTPSTMNYYLACPKSFCHKATPNRTIHVYDATPQQLSDFWQTVLKKQPNMSVVMQDPATGYFQFMQASSILHLPSEITIQVIPTSEKSATFAIYSRSMYGFYDFSSNANRVNDWILELDGLVKEMLDKQAVDQQPIGN